MFLTSYIYPLVFRAKHSQIQRSQINNVFKSALNFDVCAKDFSKLDFKYIRLHIDKIKSGFLGQNIWHAFSNIS